MIREEADEIQHSKLVITPEMIEAAFESFAIDGPYGAIWTGEWFEKAVRAMEAVDSPVRLVKD